MFATKSAINLGSTKAVKSSFSMRMSIGAGLNTTRVSNPLKSSLTLRRAFFTMDKRLCAPTSFSRIASCQNSTNMLTVSIPGRGLATDNTKPNLDNPNEPKTKTKAAKAKKEANEAASPKDKNLKPKAKNVGLTRAEKLSRVTVEAEPFEFIKAEEGKLDQDRNF